MAGNREPGRARRLASWLAAVVAVAVLALWLAAATAGGWLRDDVEGWLGERLGATVTLEEMDLGLLPPSVTVRGVSLLADGHATPVLVADSISIDGRWSELFGERRVRSIEVVRPRVEIVIAEDGGDNIPRWASTGEGGGGIALDSVRIVEGEAHFAEQRVALDLLLRRLRLQGGGHTKDGLNASLDAAELVAELPNGATYLGALSVRGRWADGRLTLGTGRLSGPQLAVDLRAGFLDVAEREWRVELAASGDSKTLASLGLDPGELRLDWAFDGAVSGRTGAEPPWAVIGTVTSPRLEMAPIRIDGVEAALRVDPSTVALDEIDGTLADGALSGRLEIDLTSELRPGRATLNVVEGDLQALLTQTGPELPSVRGSWSLDGSYDFESGNALEGAGSAVARLALSDDRGRITWRRRLAIGLRGGRVEFSSRAPAAGRPSAPADSGSANSGSAVAGVADGGERLAVRGSYDLLAGRGEIDYELATEKLSSWLELLVDPTPETAKWLPAGGTANLSGRLELGSDFWSTRVEIDQFDGRVGTLETSRLGGALTVSDSGVRDLRLDLSRARGALGVSGSYLFATPRRADALDLRVAVDGWPTSEILDQLEVAIDVDGDLTGVARIRGPLEALEGRFELASDEGGVAGVPFSQVRALLELDPARLTVEEATASLAGGDLEASGWWALDASEADYSVRATAIDLTDPSLVDFVPEGLTGTLDGDLRQSGPLERPTIEFDVGSRDLGFQGLAATEEAPARLTGRLADGEAQVEGAFEGLLSWKGGGALAESIDLAIGFETAALGELATSVLGFEPGLLSGRTDGVLRVTGNRGETLAIAVELPTLVIVSGQRTLRALEPVKARWEEDGIAVESLFLGQDGTASEIFFAGRVPVAPGQSLDLVSQMSIDTGWLELALPGWDFEEGVVDALASIGGTWEQPLVNGQGQLKQRRIVAPGVPQALRQVEAAFLFYPGSVVLDESSFGFAGGSVRTAGEVKLYGEGGLEYRFQVAGDELQLRYPEGWQLRLGADLTVTSEAGGRQLRGTVDVERALYSADVPIGLTQLLQQAFSRRPAVVEETDELLASTHLNLAIDGPGALRVRNNVADLRGDLDLTVRGTLARPIVFGDVAVESGGTLVYSGNEYDVRRAELAFANPYRIEPVIDLEATTRLQEYDITLNLAGTLERLDVTFASNPPLPNLDVLSLLAGGEAIETSASRNEGQAGSGAQAFLYGQAASAVANRVNRLFGLDKFRIDPLTGESGSLTSARVTVGKRLSSDVFATYSYDPSQNAQQILQVEWTVSRLLTLVATQNGDGTYAIDARWERSFQ